MYNRRDREREREREHFYYLMKNEPWDKGKVNRYIVIYFFIGWYNLKGRNKLGNGEKL